MTSTLVDFQALLSSFITPERISLVIRIVLMLVIGIPLVRFFRRMTGKVIQDKLSAQSEMLIKRAVSYLGWLILIVMILNEFGFKLSAFLGAAGVLGVAIGFASQTSFSNIISGIFLISEKPFVVGDIVQVGDTVGVVLSIDLLSIKVRTFDYRYVRIPNENMIKNQITNLTRFDSRRVNLMLSVAYKDNLNKVIEILKDVAANEPLAQKEPEPVVQLAEFADSGISILFGVWALNENYVALKNALLIKVKQSFDEEDIEIPFPHVKLANEEYNPLPLAVEMKNKLPEAENA
ncbi:MAG: mechanosensitive ion channel family protein [Candidatus Cloacimonadaceae bacterium]